MKKIGILGGTFNPVHIGHLLLAQCALEQVNLDEVWMLPTGQSYMKSEEDMVAAEERLAMVSIAIENNPKLHCVDIEVKRTGRTYTYETLEELHVRNPEDQFFFIIGADCLFTIETWKCPDRIFENCTIIAAVRGNASYDKMQQKVCELKTKYEADIILLPFFSLNISSTIIRDRVKEGKSIRYFVPEKVSLYIEEKGFYRGKR